MTKVLKLTPREKEVAKLLLKGLTNREISSRLEMALNTVKFHNTVIYRKLGLKSRTKLMAKMTGKL
jgi:LuxR family maltose regulon positive regulatory protein